MGVPNLHYSLPVSSVQELAKEPNPTVPRRYVRAEERDPVTNPADESLRVPLIDMANLLNMDAGEKELMKLQEACRDWGAFQVINHGIPEEIVESIRKETRDFFALPLQEKSQVAQQEGSLEGYGQAFVVSEDQPLDWSGMLFFKVLPVLHRNPNLWNNSPQGLRDALASYTEEARRLAVSLLGFMAMALGLEEGDFSGSFMEGEYSVRMNCYPPCPQFDQVIGISPHSDITGITLLLESDHTAGLQVRKDGYWTTVKPVSGGITVNVGNIVEILSNGAYRSPEHRAIVNGEKERRSIVTFCYPCGSATVGPSPGLVRPENPAAFVTISRDEYFDRFFNRGTIPAGTFMDSLKTSISS
ncbi:hypothetical protein H6P81_001210 [Aristolochia fimbriata]|uniref:Fe2OG dioxygenase domain-containing protein n=1 Tax=Aristolochia fimbriata TaxID=158543 RepID=A0AAV7F9J0_ARIFI|nr:hypothetical protein H6P81_001210 [Aristolochia fimbriata]